MRWWQLQNTWEDNRNATNAVETLETQPNPQIRINPNNNPSIKPNESIILDFCSTCIKYDIFAIETSGFMTRRVLQWIREWINPEQCIRRVLQSDQWSDSSGLRISLASPLRNAYAHVHAACIFHSLQITMHRRASKTTEMPHGHAARNRAAGAICGACWYCCCVLVGTNAVYWW